MEKKKKRRKREMNVSVIRDEILKKTGSDPYFPSPTSVFRVRTDVNQFPYGRFFRGQRDSMDPTVWEREAGYSPLITTRDTTNDVSTETTSNDKTCFQYACSTITPCRRRAKNYQAAVPGCVFTSP